MLLHITFCRDPELGCCSYAADSFSLYCFGTCMRLDCKSTVHAALCTSHERATTGRLHRCSAHQQRHARGGSLCQQVGAEKGSAHGPTAVLPVPLLMATGESGIWLRPIISLDAVRFRGVALGLC